MEQEKIIALTEQIRQICPPECRVEAMPTQQQGKVCLIVIYFPSLEIELPVQSAAKIDWGADRFRACLKRDPILKQAYDWERKKIYNFHHEKILPILDEQHFRAVYCSGGRFILYVHTFGCMKMFDHVFNYVGMNDGDKYKYVGHRRNLDMLIGFLTRTEHSF